MTPNPDVQGGASLLSYAYNFLAGLVGGSLAGGVFIGSTRATLDAHEKRLDTAEGDVRYEIRALRETVEENHRQEMGLIATLVATKRDA